MAPRLRTGPLREVLPRSFATEVRADVGTQEMKFAAFSKYECVL